MTWTEIAGFVTGALCVWLVVKRNIGNFPVGIANLYFILCTAHLGAGPASPAKIAASPSR
ncbi:nicotinamide mononucleotide transporter [Hyphomonas adhaerens]|uniref:nicotinamide mononucleotide transporter n=1 Tax=Hyphomonas adhaerens TaxID=81029 RepID=UPI0012EC0356